jgi:hypothetical protein
MDMKAVRAAFGDGTLLSTAQVVETLLGGAPKEPPPIEISISPDRMVSLA